MPLLLLLWPHCGHPHPHRGHCPHWSLCPRRKSPQLWREGTGYVGRLFPFPMTPFLGVIPMSAPLPQCLVPGNPPSPESLGEHLSQCETGWAWTHPPITRYLLMNLCRGHRHAQGTFTAVTMWISMGLRGHYYYNHSHFVEEKNEVQRDQAAYPSPCPPEAKAFSSCARFIPLSFRRLSHWMEEEALYSGREP